MCIRDSVYPKDKPFSIRNILREPYFTYEYKATADLMIEMRKASVNLAIVLDEYGATAGLVTLEDLLEEIVGEIRDEYDEDEVEDIKEIQPEREYVVQGSAKLDDINEALHINPVSYTHLYGLLLSAIFFSPGYLQLFPYPSSAREKEALVLFLTDTLLSYLLRSHLCS